MNEGTVTRDPMPLEKRRELIRERMLACQWERGKSRDVLAAECGVSVYTIDKDAQAVALELKRALSDEELAAQVEQGLREIKALAFEQGEPAAATGAYRLHLEARGLLKQKHEHRHELAGMSDDEIVAGVIAELVRDDRRRPMLREALATWDREHEGEN